MKIGNQKGWTIAGIIAIVYLALLVALEISGSATAPTALASSPAAMTELKLPESLMTIAPMPDTVDASTLMRDAAISAKVNPQGYERFKLSEIPEMRALSFLIDQSKTSNARARGENVAYGVGYKSQARSDQEGYEVIEIGAARAGALYRAARRLPEAREIFEAQFSLGYKLFASRLHFGDVETGLRLMGGGLAGLKVLAGDADKPDEVARLEAAEADLAKVGADARAVYAAISSADLNAMGKWAGDIPVIARSSKERVFRTEATLKLGRMKYGVGKTATSADQRNAKRVIRELLTDRDPAVALAAKEANALRIEDYRALR